MNRDEKVKELHRVFSDNKLVPEFISKLLEIPEKLKALMLETEQIATDTGSVIDGYEAVELGLIDKVGGLNDALDALDEMIKNKNQCDGDSCKI